MRDRLCIAYATALKAAHGGARVEIHLGADAVEWLRSLASEIPVAGFVWGFPVVESPVADHISVHTVQVVP